MTPRATNLKRLLAPRHIAFIGGRKAETAMRMCAEMGFAGEMWFVHPSRVDVQGRPCYRSVEDLPEAPDAVFIGVRSEMTIELVRALAARGAGGCVCYAAGFAEVGADGHARQDALKAAAGEMAVVGPNCYGLLNYLDRASLWPDEHGGAPQERGVAFISQSGNLGVTVSFQERSVPLAYIASLGNQAVLGPAEFVATLCEDPRVTAIGLYIEGLNDVAGFSRAAEKALINGVPLVALKAGSSEQGARLALTHTSSLAGSRGLYDALFERLGVVQVDSLATMLETLKLLTVCGPLPTPRIVSLSCSGGEAALVADQGANHGLVFPAFSDHQATSLKASLTDFTNITNPFDYNTGIWGDRAALEKCFTVAVDGEADAAVLVLDHPSSDRQNVEEWSITLDAFIAASRRTKRKGIVMSILAELFPKHMRERAIGGGVTPLQGFDEGMSAIAGAAHYGARREALKARAKDGRLTVDGAAMRLGDPYTLDEWESKRRLAAAGLPVPEARLVTAAEAPAAAQALGFPVVVKAVGAALIHKTEAGAVALNLNTEAEVVAAIARIQTSIADIPNFRDKYLVERLVTGGVAELIVGIKRDDAFGLALVMGSGGVLVELVGDVQTLLMPVDRSMISDALDRLKVSDLLAGYRGQAAGDRDAVVEAIQAIGGFAHNHRDELVEMDVNPLIVMARGVVAVDAVVRFAKV